MVVLWRGELAVRGDEQRPDLSRIEYYSPEYTAALARCRDITAAGRDHEVTRTMIALRLMRGWQLICIVLMVIDAVIGSWWSLTVVALCFGATFFWRRQLHRDHVRRMLDWNLWLSHDEEQLQIHRALMRRHRAEEN